MQGDDSDSYDDYYDDDDSEEALGHNGNDKRL